VGGRESLKMAKGPASEALPEEENHSGQTEKEAGYPEAGYHFFLGPAAEFEMVMDRAHAEYPLTVRVLEIGNLNDNGKCFDDEQTPDYQPEEFGLGADCQASESSADGQRAGIPHENLGGVRVIPEKSEDSAEGRRANDRELLRSRDIENPEHCGKSRASRNKANE